MADLESQSTVLEDYESVLEELTFNSKPIINMLTMKADKYRIYAPAIVELVKTRFFKVRQECKIPTLYLMDSMIKNLGGEFLEELTKGIVGVFCHAFEALNDPKIRIALYKLRQTWLPYIPVRKLAAIDEHIHAIDPNWPITAQEPSSPTIFLNPKFLEPKEDSAKRNSGKSSTERRSSPLPKKSILKPSLPAASSKPSSNSLAPPTIENKGRRSPQNTLVDKQASKSPSPMPSSSMKHSKPTKSPSKDSGANDYRIPKKKKVQFQSPPTSSSSSSLSSTSSLKPVDSFASSLSQPAPSQEVSLAMKDKRKKLLAQQRQIKTNKQLSMGILPPLQDDVSLDRVIQKHKRSSSPSPEKRPSESVVKRPRSASPTVTVDTRGDEVPVESDSSAGIAGRKHRNEDTSIEFDANKRIKTEPIEDLVLVTDNNPMKRIGGGGGGMDNDRTTDINDLLPDFILKKQEYMLEQARKRLQSDTLTSEQRDQLLRQVDQLLELQATHKEERTDKFLINDKSVSHGDSVSRNLDSVSFSHTPVTNSVSHFNDSVSHSHDFVSHPHDFVPHPHDSASHSRDLVSHPRPSAEIQPHRTLLPFPPPGDYIPPQRDFPPPRGLGRPPPPRANFRRRGGRGFKRGRRDRAFREHSPPLMRRGPGGMRDERGPPPPHHLSRHPLPQESEGPALVSDLYEKLRSSGLLLPPDGEAGSHPPPVRRGPALPMIRLNIRELKMDYEGLHMLLHEGEPCTSCGLRFREDQREEYQAHLDWHYQENRLDKDGSRATMRNWFLHPDDWITFDGSSLINQNEPLLSMEQESKEDSVGRDENKSAGISCQVLPGEDTQVCGVCHEQLEQFWEEDEEEWHFKDALRTGDGVLYHSYCYVDSKESLGLMSVDSSPISETAKPLNI
ncbi:PREDICTED: pre-mRNA cleavage complex 2 protein Pcf11-like [Amphimedon queenslandica]|uniref:CID domain-containing protein n=1 Tax=Amphimedon queenslandica TaxID=400682 RepID=A0A1X7UD39_AMPQE|nr:PREDICTED: pre-mRNA cleavage complex 2 protein Pcf11-like [Amphimedon queenslandica]|eukprot:XP_019854910.1 PREDICTED: pre-mRNA cleavage complex 2 protein Pcf11-like [Amphimedon queenslandica]